VSRLLRVLDQCALWLEEDGETRRLDIARAQVIEPEVFCLDEPTANLDPKNSDIID